MEKVIVIGGATGIIDLEGIKEAFESLGFKTLFVEANFMKKYTSFFAPQKQESSKNTEIPKIIFTDSLSDFFSQSSADENQTNVAQNSPVKNDVLQTNVALHKLTDFFCIVPITEYWISYCIKSGFCCISERALKSSRSKKFFYELIGNAGLPTLEFVEISPEENLSDCSMCDIKALLFRNGAVVVKPESLNSGLGIQIVNTLNMDRLEEYIFQASTLKTKNLRLQNIENKGCIVTEYLNGTEYSADVFYYKGRISIVRVCKKKIAIINNKPCTLVCQLIKPTLEIEQSLVQWSNVLFDSSDISFGQFDFIVQNSISGNSISESKSKASLIVPIDFACRIGGGMQELMSQADHNLYAAAISDNQNIALINDDVLTQLNYLPIEKGIIVNDNFALEPGFQKVFKHKGDYVTSLPSSIGSRIALVIQKNMSQELPADIEKSLLIGKPYIACDSVTE